MNRIKGGIYGMLIGDALGVPYEFNLPQQLPPMDQLDFIPPAGFQKTYNQPAGTWSDDGAQGLCLLDSLLSCREFRLEDFSDRLLNWYEKGLWAVDGVVFDVGVQTAQSLMAYKNGMIPEQCGLIVPDGKGNGALMRVLPLALWHNGSDKELVLMAHEQCKITHGNSCSHVCCGFYSLTARYLLHGYGFDESHSKALKALRGIYAQMPEYDQELEWSIRPNEPLTGRGTGYVADCLRSAFMCVQGAVSYEDAVKSAVALGNDTDTTACVTGGLAGILYGYENIPERWINALREREKVELLLQRMDQ